MAQNATLVLSGGGAKGAFQVGAERVLREEFGYRWERIFGVSVGALNAALLSQEEYERLSDIWLSIREQDVYKKLSWIQVAWRIGIERKLGFYDNTPLRRLIERHAAARPYRIPAHVGRVSLVTGAYELVANDDPDFLDAVWESATMPIIWDPIGPEARVDGGIRNVTPLGDALDYEPREIIVIMTSSYDLEPADRPRDIVGVAKRSLVDVAINEIVNTDVREFVRINSLVQQAAELGISLKRPNGEPYRYCPITVILPAQALGDTLDFTQGSIRARLTAGEAAARRALQRPSGPTLEPGAPLHA